MCYLNFSDAGDGIFRLWGPIPCLLMSWLPKSLEHQQAWYWLCRTDSMYYYSRGWYHLLGLSQIKDMIQNVIISFVIFKQVSMLWVQCATTFSGAVSIISRNFVGSMKTNSKYLIAKENVRNVPADGLVLLYAKAPVCERLQIPSTIHIMKRQLKGKAAKERFFHHGPLAR